jgi:hypothetical protein
MSSTRDECIETRNLQEHRLARQKLSGPLVLYRPSHRSVPSAGSLAVIFQPAFVPFVAAVEYLPLCCLFMSL